MASPRTGEPVNSSLSVAAFAGSPIRRFACFFAIFAAHLYMTVTQDAVGRRVVLSPQEGLVAGGPAEEFEQRVQTLFRNGSTDLLVDLRRVPTIDSRGVRALVRAHTSAQRLGATFRIACPCPAVRTILEVSKLDSVFVVYDTIDAAQKRDLRW